MAKSGGQSEAEFLAHEAMIATAAIGRLKTEMLQNLKLAADPKAWTEKYPLPALGTAAVGGFAAAAVVKPMIFGSAKKPEQNGYAYPAYPGQPYPKPRSSFQKFTAPLISLAKNSIKSAIIAGISAKGATEAVKEDAQASQHPAEHAREPGAAEYSSAEL